MHPACLITWHTWCILGQDVKLMISMNSQPVNSTPPAHHHPSLQTWYHSFRHCPGSLRDSQEQRIKVGGKKKKNLSAQQQRQQHENLLFSMSYHTTDLSLENLGSKKLDLKVMSLGRIHGQNRGGHFPSCIGVLKLHKPLVGCHSVAGVEVMVQ